MLKKTAPKSLFLWRKDCIPALDAMCKSLLRLPQ